MTRPTIHVTNWSSKKLHGPGLKYTIMVKPRTWEHGSGTVHRLVPGSDDYFQMTHGLISFDEYRLCYETSLQPALEHGLLAPGALEASQTLVGDDPAHVKDGDTLCCACSRDDAAAGWCHRAWAARMLVAAGWRVVLDGHDITDGSHP